MLRIKFTIAFCFSLSLSQVSMAQKLELDGSWKYATTNDSTFSSFNFDDASWNERAANNLRFNKEDNSNSLKTIWLRKTVVIPSSFKSQLEKTGALSLYMGRIYNSDEFFFNGKLTGKTNSSDIKRVYLLHHETVKWDEPNVFAFRIHYYGDNSGLQDAAAPYLQSALPSVIFDIKPSATGVDNKEHVKSKLVVYNCVVKSNSLKNYAAEVKAKFYDFNNKKLKTVTKQITLAPGENAIEFPFQSSTGFLRIQYHLSVPALAYRATRNDQYGYNEVRYTAIKPLVAGTVKSKFVSAAINEQIIKGWLGVRMNANEKERLLKVDEKEILSGFINRPGSHAWLGEHVGKFLDAAINAYQNSGKAELKIQIDRIAQQLIATQLQDGYLGTYTPENYWTSWDVWSHKYNIIGLLRYYSLSGFKPALNAAKKAGDLLCVTFGNNPGQKDIIKAGTHVGMASTSVLEPMVDLYRYTGNKKYLDFCHYIIKSYEQENGPKILSTLAKNGGRTDQTANAKAYEMLSNLVGVLKLYRITSDAGLLQPVVLAWEDIVKSRMYITGTASSYEKFNDDHDLPAGENAHMGEGCVTTTWIQLNYELLCITGQMKYVNELERSVYNHLTGAENPQTGCVSYYTPLVGKKPFRCVITCCMSSVPRGIAMIPLFTNGKMHGSPSFLFYQPGAYTTSVLNGNKVSFTTATNFPAEGKVVINVTMQSPLQFPVEFRKPYWASGFSIKINGQDQVIDNNETITVKRLWKNGDAITINFSMPLIMLEGGKSYPGQIAFQRGPQVLAFDQNLNQVGSDTISFPVTNLSLELASTSLPNNWVGGQAFKLKTSGHTDKKFILVPYADASQTGGAITTWFKKEDNQ